MTAAAQYWRIGVRDFFAGGGARYLPLASLKLYDAAGAQLTPSSTSMPQIRSGDSTSSLTDSNNATTATMTFSSGSTFQYITYDFGTGVTALVDSFLIRISSTDPATGVSGTRTVAASVDIIIQASSNNSNWVVINSAGRPMEAENTDYRFAGNPDSILNPVPSRTEVGGFGGIYGVVSEDGTALGNRPVVLLDRSDFSRIGYTTTDSSGGYVFSGLNTLREYTVLSVDPSGPPYKNALIWDRIVPINASGVTQTQSPFWAQRLRDSKFGYSLAWTNFLDGSTINDAETAPGSVNYLFYNVQNYSGWLNPALDGLTTYSTAGAAGAFKFLKSGLSGIVATGAGVFGANAANQPDNYESLSFELVCIPPTGSERDLIATWGGTMNDLTSNSTPDNMLGTYQNNEATVTISAAIQVTTSTINVRMSLGGINQLYIVRASTSCVQSQINHIVATYSYNNEIKLYLNGSLVQTTSIPGSGRLYTCAMDWSGATYDITTAWRHTSNPQDAARRINQVAVLGSGLNSHANTPQYSAGILRTVAPWGGYFGCANFFGRVLSSTDVTALYNSLINTSTHSVSSTQSGYAAAVEADNPSYYYRLNDLSFPTSPVKAVVGRKDIPLTYRSGTTFSNAANFTSGQTAVDFSSSGGAYVYGSPISSTFTAEMWLKPTSLTTAGYLLSAVSWLQTRPILLQLTTSGLLVLTIIETSGTTNTFSFVHTALSVGSSYHIVITYDPYTDHDTNLYINGSLASTLTTGVFSISDRVTLLGIGCNPAPASNFYGYAIPAINFGNDHARVVMGEFAWYNYKLSASRIQAHYDARNY
jgi:hypothetical protein